MATCAMVNASAALMPRSGYAAACAALPSYGDVAVRHRVRLGPGDVDGAGMHHHGRVHAG